MDLPVQQLDVGELPVLKVTVYLDRAEVRRSVKVKAPEGRSYLQLNVNIYLKLSFQNTHSPSFRASHPSSRDSPFVWMGSTVLLFSRYSTRRAPPALSMQWAEKWDSLISWDTIQSVTHPI